MNSRYYAMIFIILLLWSSILFATQPFWSSLPSTQTIERHDSLTGFDITKYVLNLSINEQTHYLSGDVTAYITAENNLSSIEYNLMGGSLTVTEVKVNGISSLWTHQNGIINIPLTITAGQNFTTQVYYSGVTGNSPAPYNIGMLFTTTAVYTLSNPDAGRYWWPSYDHPWDKALIDEHITVRSDWLVAGNGLRSGIVDNGNGTRTHSWICAHPVATYVVGIAAGPYIEYLQQAGNIPIQNFVLPGQLNNATVDFSNVPEMISFFSGVYGAYPFEKYGHSIVNMSTYAAMEHQTQTTIGAAYITGNHAYEDIVAHELSHQWMGNNVTPLTMTEVWLKESFATYSEALWVEHYLGWQSACTYIQNELQNYYINWENQNGAHTIFNPSYNEMFAPPTYQKSASVLHMLRLKMGNTAFFNFIHDYYNTYQGSNVITAELVQKAQQNSGLDLTQFFQQWIYSPGIPSANLTILSNGINQIKVFAKSSSPTATQFFLEIPLKLPGSVLLDSLVVIASPQGQINYHSYNPTLDNLSNLLIDPNHWVLNRGLTSNTMNLTACLPANQSVTLSWNAFSVPLTIVGYNIYRKQLPNGNWIKLNQTVITGLTYLDTSVANNITYQYYVQAVDSEGFESLPSNQMQATPIDFPFDNGFLLVDETRDGNGGVISPNDQMVDDFYAQVLTNMPYTAWDVATQGLPDLVTLSHYALVLWHSDDFSDILIDDHISILGSYVNSGGKLVVSGWKYPGYLPQSFYDLFFPGVSPSLHNSAVLVSAQSNIYPVLHIDPLKLTSTWNGLLPMTYTFPNAQNMLYTAEILNGEVGNGEPLAIRMDNAGTIVLLGFPLYCFQSSDVQSFLRQLLPSLYPAVGLTDEQDIIPGILMSIYPNPFSRQLSIRWEGKSSISSINVYNLRGQRVKTLTGIKHSEIKWDGFDEHHQPLAAGIYLLKMQVGKQSVVRKVLKMK